MQRLTLLRAFARQINSCHFVTDSSVAGQRPPVLADKLANIRRKRNEIFSEEKSRQERLISRIDKIQVDVFAKTPQSLDGEEKLCSLAMNKDISTPYNCAQHINEHTTTSAVLAMVDGKPWDMHQPLIGDCQIKFLYFTDPQPSLANNAYWRSCSFVLGYILETAFSNGFDVKLHSWPSSNYRTGSFVYDVQLDKQLENWQPNVDEYRALSKIPAKDLRTNKYPFEPLLVDIAIAEAIFANNPFKLKQLSSIAETSSPVRGKIPLYRMHDHIDISRGPMISNTGLLGYYAVCAFHPIETKDFGKLTRVQGVSVPANQYVNSWTWETVCQAAKRQNPMPVPSLDRFRTNATVPKSDPKKT